MDYGRPTSSDLLPGEHLLWEGRPIRYQLLRPLDAINIPFSLFWAAIIFAWERVAIGFAWPLSIFGIPLVLLGIYVTVGRFIVRGIVLRRTRYAVTNWRVLVYGGPSGTRLTSEYLRSLPPPVIKERPDASGSIAFGSFDSLGRLIAASWNRRDAMRRWYDDTSIILHDVDNVRYVRDLIVRAVMTPT